MEAEKQAVEEKCVELLLEFENFDIVDLRHDAKQLLIGPFQFVLLEFLLHSR